MLLRSLFLLLILSFFYLLWGNWTLSFTSLDEGRNMSAVLHMLKSGDFIHPMYNCQPRFEKPPMLYWSVALLSQLFGLNEFSARLVSGLSAFGITVLIYLLARDFYSKDMALKASLIFLTFPHIWIEARALVPEMLNTFFTFLGLYTFLKGRFIWGWIALSFAFLTKGPVGVVLALGAYLLWRRRLDFLKVEGILLFLLLGFSWYLLMFSQYGYEYFYRFFIYENIMRYTGERSTHPAPLYYYPLVIAVGSLWYFPLYPKLIKNFKRDWLPLILWFFFVLAFFSLAKNKLHHYILFAYPPLAILLAHVVRERYMKFTIFVSLMSLIALTILLYLYQGERFVPKAWSIVKAYQGPVYFYKAEDSALVYYSERCIGKLEDPSLAEGLVITKEKYVQELANCKVVLKGREFDGDYTLLQCNKGLK
ncbi:MAG: ArnT family glycosyltransferase [Aquificaceae bacterium]